MDIRFDNICPVCKKSKSQGIPVFLKCTCKGLIVGNKLIKMDGPFDISKGKFKRRKWKNYLDKKAKEWLEKKGKKDA